MWNLKTAKVSLLAIVLVCLAAMPVLAGVTKIQVRPFVGLFGGGNALDGISAYTIHPDDMALGHDGTGVTWYFMFPQDTGATTESTTPPYRVCPDDLQAGGSGSSGTTTWRQGALSGNTVHGKVFVIDTTTITGTQAAQIVFYDAMMAKLLSEVSPYATQAALTTQTAASPWAATTQLDNIASTSPWATVTQLNNVASSSPWASTTQLNNVASTSPWALGPQFDAHTGASAHSGASLTVNQVAVGPGAAWTQADNDITGNTICMVIPYDMVLSGVSMISPKPTATVGVSIWYISGASTATVNTNAPTQLFGSISTQGVGQSSVAGNTRIPAWSTLWLWPRTISNGASAWSVQFPGRKE